MDDDSYPEAVLTHLNGNQSKIMWCTSSNERTEASSHPVQDSGLPSGTHNAQYLNITLPLGANYITRVAYVFAGQGPSVELPHFTFDSSTGCTVNFKVKANGITYI